MRLPLATRYAVLVAGLTAGALIVSGLVETWFSHRDGRAALEALHREKARAAADSVSRFIEEALRGLDWATLGTRAAARDGPTPTASSS
jgi:hypothetical protein